MPRIDGQITNLAGELARRGLQVAITYGNAKAIDLFAQTDQGRTFNVQVKALRKPNEFPVGKTIRVDTEYVFVLLNLPPKAPEYFIVTGNDLKEHPERFGKWFTNYKTFP